MLRGKDALGNNGWIQTRRWLCLIALVSVALGVSVLRGPAQALPRKEAKADPDTGDAGAMLHRQPFDCSYLGENVLGVVAMRPAEILSYPGIRAHAQAVNFAVQRVFLEAGMKDPGLLGLDVADIEQVVAGIYFQTNPKAPKGQRHMILVGQPMIRTVKPMDWAQMLQLHSGTLAKHDYMGKAYYSVQPPPGKFPSRINFFFPDERTLVCDSQASIERLIQRGAAAQTPRPWDSGWQKVNDTLFAVGLNFAAPLFNEIDGSSKPENSLDFLLETLVLKAILDKANLVVGIEGTSQEFQVRACLACTEERTAEKLAKAEAESIRVGREHLQAKEAKASIPLEKIGMHFVADLLAHAAVKQHGTEVELRMSTKLLFADVLRELLAAAK